MGRQASHRIGESRGCADAEADMPSAEASGARCVQNFDGSRNSAIHTTYRISLRSSSIREPRYPLLRVVVWFDNLGRQRPRDASEANTTHTIVVSCPVVRLACVPRDDNCQRERRKYFFTIVVLVDAKKRAAVVHAHKSD